MAGEYQFSLIEVTKQQGTKTILKDVNLSFFYGAHIGVIGGNGADRHTPNVGGAVDREPCVRCGGQHDRRNEEHGKCGDKLTGKFHFCGLLL